MYGITASVMASCGHFLSWLASLGAEPDLFTGLHLAFLSPSSCGGRALSAGAPSRRELRWSRGTCEIHSLLSPFAVSYPSLPSATSRACDVGFMRGACFDSCLHHLNIDVR